MEAGKGHEAELPSGRSLKGKGEGMNGAVSPEEIEKGKGFIQKGKMMQDEAKGAFQKGKIGEDEVKGAFQKGKMMIEKGYAMTKGKGGMGQDGKGDDGGGKGGLQSTEKQPAERYL